MAARKGAVAAAAERAGGERRRRRGTPLIVGSASASPAEVRETGVTTRAPAATPTPAPTKATAARSAPAKRSRKATAATAPAPGGAGGSKAARAKPVPKAATASTPERTPARAPETTPEPAAAAPASRRATHRPAPKVTSGPSRKARASSGGRSSRSARPSRADIAARAKAERARERPLHAVPDPVVPLGGATPRPAGPASATTSLVPGVEDLVAAAVGALRAAAAATGISPEEVEATVARVLAYVRRRIEGDYTVDDFGFDADFTETIALPLVRPLYRSWFRVEVRGIENIPATGGALVVANHSGTVAMDSLMTQVAVHDEHPQHRHLRMLGADLVFNTPFLGTFARRSGSTLATNPDAERLLTSGELVGVWPEGFKGVGKPFSERYKLQRFGRGGFVSAALRTGVPIIPCSIVGAEEIYPMIGNLKTVARVLGMPYFPVTPTFPLLGPLGMIPLPSKWIIEFGRPVDTTVLGAAAADDPMVVFDLTDQVRETIQQSLYSLLMQRRSVFS